MLIPLTQVDRDLRLRGATNLSQELEGVPREVRRWAGVCTLLGRGDGRRLFAVRLVEAAGIGRIEGGALRQCDQCDGT
jgi:hypothetical protein